MCWSLATCARLLPSASPDSACASCGEAGPPAGASKGLKGVLVDHAVPLTRLEPGALVNSGAFVAVPGDSCSSCSSGECSGSSPTAAAVAGVTPGGVPPAG